MSCYALDETATTANALSVDAALQQFSPSNLPVNQQVSIIKSLYEKQLTGIEALQDVFPANWLLEGQNLEPERVTLEATLAQVLAGEGGSLDVNTTIDTNKRQLLELKLRWLHFSHQERLALINEATTKQTFKTNEKDAFRNIEKAEASARELAVSKKHVDLALAKSVDDREKILLTILRDLENRFEWIALQTKLMGEAQVNWSQFSLAWQQVASAIDNSLEDETFVPGTQDFKAFRQQLRERLTASNDVVRSKERFLNHYFSKQFEQTFADLPPGVQVRESDNAAIRDLINKIQQKRTELLSATENFHRSRSMLVQKLIAWQYDYRLRVLYLRGQLIKQVIASNSFALNRSEPVKVEIVTIFSSIQFYFWKSRGLGDSFIAEKSAFTFSLFSHLFKVVALAGLIVWLYLRRQSILGAARKWCLKQTQSRKQVRLINSISKLIGQLYVFIILLILGQLLIEFLVGVGFSTASVMVPILRHTVVFFLLLGLINFVSPLLSQRESQAGRDTEEVSAMEAVFEVVPKLYIYYWLVSGYVSIVLLQYLQENLLRFYLLNIIAVFFVLALYLIIWFRRRRWRLINEKATHSLLWQKIGSRSHGKFWEPVILLVGGGIGVYRVAWSILLARLTEMEMTRSFQAMVSRAILERQYKRSATKINPARFPEAYWRIFNYITPAAPNWYIRREQGEELLDSIYSEWRDKNKRARVLICGDRGIGKTELIANFLRVNEVEALHAHLMTGDTSLNNICQRLAIDFFGDSTLCDPEQVTQALLDLPPKVICIENIENSLLRKVGGFDGFAFTIDLLLRASKHHLCIVTCTSYAWTIAKQGLVGANCFSETIMLRGMSEQHLKNMLLSRHQDAEHIPPDFSGLNFGDNVQGKQFKNLESKTEGNDKAVDLYFRILWDYTRGNPRQALYYWKTSLNWESGKIMVRLFEVPEQKVLEGLQDITLMLLAALIEHNGLTIEGLAEVMNLPVTNVRRRIEELAPYDIVFCILHGEKAGWHVESFWTRAVEIYLEKRQFLFRGDKI